MASAFNLTAQINLRGPSNVRNIVSDIRRQLGTITGDVNLRINPATTRNVTALNTALTTLNNNLTATTNNATNAANAIRQFGAAVANIGNTTNGLNRSLNNAAAAANNAGTNIGNTATQTRAASGEMVEFGRTAGLAVRRFAAFSMSAGAIMGLTNAIRQGIDAFVEYDKQFVKLQQVTGESSSGLSQLAKTITGLSTSLGVSSTELTNVSLTLAQAGLTARDTERALKALALSSLAPSFDNMNQTVEGSIALMRQFGISASDLEKSLGAVNAVSAKFAVEASDIIAAIQRTGGVFASASKGVSEGTDALNEFIAVFTSVRATTRESAETIATGLRTIFTRIQRGGTIEALKEFGVTLTDAEGKFVGAYKAVQLLSEGLNKIDPRDIKFSQIVEELGGFRQIGKVIPLIQQFATAQQALAVAQAGQTSLTEDAVTAQLSLANQAAKVREEFLALFREIGGSDTFQALAKGALSLASALISVADSVKGVLPVLAIMTAFRGASSIRQFGTGFLRGFRPNAAQGAKKGGFIKYASGGEVPVALTPGEAVIEPTLAAKIGTSTLRKMNYADRNGYRQKRASGGGVGIVPGQGNSDSYYTTLPVGSFVIRKAATQTLGLDARQKFAGGGKTKPKKSSAGKYIAPIVPATERAHIGDDLYIDQRSLAQYLDKYAASKLKRSIGQFSGTNPGTAVETIKSMSKSEYDKFIKEKLNLSVKKRIRLNFPRTFNQALRATDPGVVLKNDLVNIISSSQNLTDPLGSLSASDINQIKQNTIRKIKTLKALPASSYRKNLGWRPDTPDSAKQAPAFDSDYQLNPLAAIIESSVNEKTKQRLQNNIDLLFKSSTKDATYKSSKTGQERSRTQSRESAKLSTISKKYSDDPRNVQRRENSYYDRALENAIWSLPEKKSRKKPKTTTRGYPRDYIAVHHLNTGGVVQRFADGGMASRNVGYIDSDEIAQLFKDPVKGPMIKAEMDRLGIKSVSDYKEHLSNLAATRRSEGSLKRLSNIFGVAGSGKSTFLQGGTRASEADNARLRKTNRYPILTEQDVLRSDQVIDSTSVAGPSQKKALSAADRIVALSSRTKESQNILKKHRQSRDTTGKNLFGRKPGSTKSAPLDSGEGEAYIAATQASGVDPKRVATFKLGENFTKTRTTQPRVRSPKKTGLFYGNFGPTTAGHLGAIDEAKKLGIPPQDMVALVGGDTPLDFTNKDPHARRTGIFPQTANEGLPSRVGMAQATFGARGVNVSAMPKGSGPGSIPYAFKTGEDDYIVPRGAGKDIALVSEKDDSSLTKYTSRGYSTHSMDRFGGISGTAAREAIDAGDIAKMKKLLSPEGFDYIQKHLDVLQQRPGLLESIFSKFESNSLSGKGLSGQLKSVKDELSGLPARKTKTTPPEIVARMESLRKERDDLLSRLGRRPAKILSRLESMKLSRKQLGGHIQKFMAGQYVKSKGGRKKAERLTDMTLLEAQQKTASEIIGELTITGAQQALERAGAAGVSAQTLLRKLKLNPDETRLKNSVLSAYVEKVNAKVQSSKQKDKADTITAKKANTLFGVIGMFGNGFPAENITLEDGLKKPTTVRVFGAVLDKNKAEKDARLEQRQNRLSAINTKRTIKGKSRLSDSRAQDIKNAPMASALSKEYLQEDLSGITKRTGITPQMTPALKKSLADSQGSKFQSDVTATLIKTPEGKKISDSMMTDNQQRSIDFPYGIGMSMAKNWFNNALLANIPVDAKRTLTGPRGKILKNITNYLKVKGFAGGGGVSNKFANKVNNQLYITSSAKKPGSYMIVRDGVVVEDGLNALQVGKKFDQMKLYDSLGYTTGINKDAAKTIMMPKQIKRASGGEVPILAQEGEYVINKHSAKAIGYGNLARLNKYHTGGKVQKFAKGTSVRPLGPGEYIRSGMTYDIRNGEADALQQREDQIRQRAQDRQQRNRQTAESTPQARTLKTNVIQERDSRIQAINKKYGQNILDIDERILRVKQAALKQLGLNLTDSQAMNQVMKMSLKADKEIKAAKQMAVTQYKQGLKGIIADTSGVSSKYDPSVRGQGAAGGNKTGQEYYDKQYRQERIEGLKERRKSGISGVFRSTQLRTRDFISRVAPNALKSAGLMSLDPQEKAFADQRRASSKIAPLAAGRRSSDLMRTLTQSDSFQALDPAAKKQALIDAGYGKGGSGSRNILAGNQARRNNPPGGGGGGGGGRGGNTSASNQGMGMNRAMTASFMIPMIADMFTSGTPTTAAGAYNQTLTQGTATTVGSSMMMGSMMSEMTQGMGGIAKFAGPAAMAVTAVIGMTKAFIDAENAAREMAISLASKNLEASLETTSKSFEEFRKDLKNEVKERVAARQIGQSTAMADQLQTEKSKARRGFTNLLDTGAGSSERSDILFEKGMSDYISASFDPKAQQKLFATLIPKKSAEAAKDYTSTAAVSSQFIEEKIRSGTRIKDVAGTPDFNKLTRSLALADAAVQEQIMNIQNSIDMTQEEKNAKKEAIIVSEGEKKAREIQAVTLKQMKLDELSKSANHLQNSLERMFQNMEQAIARNVYELNNMSQQAELSAAALSGNAKAGQVSLKSINVLQNPRAYNKADRAAAAEGAANMFGSQSDTMRGLLQAGGTLEDTVMSTINKTMKEDPTAGNEKIGIRIQNSIEQALEQLKLPSDVSSKLGQEVNDAIGQIRKNKDEKIDFSDLMEKIPQLGKVMDSTRRAQEAAIKALEHWQNNLNDYSNAMNQMVEGTIEANSRFRRASDIQVRGQMELDKALGKEISLRQQLDASLAGVKAQTGGQTNPALIAQNIRTLETQRATQQSMSNTAGARGYAGGDEFMMMEDRLRNTNIALRENYDALKSMADNTEMASIAMSKINEIQQKRQAGVNMAERLVTSSPQELSQLNRAMDRLNNNMQGGINFGSSADQRKESLDAFNMIAPFLGEKQNAMKANVLESMLIESGVGVNNMMADVLQSLRNPEGDPEMQEAIAAYKKAVDVQSLANDELGRITMLMNQNTADIAAQKLVAAMKGVPFTFENSQLKDIADEIRQLRTVVEKKPEAMAAAGKSTGGIIYAAAGQMIDFQPKGTDTVPAMLTPGEFVVNRSATQKHLPLLKTINSGNYSNGGKVKYYADGGYVVTGGFAPTSTVEKESNLEYPIINDGKPLTKEQIDKASEEYTTFKGNFYAAEPTVRNILPGARASDGSYIYPGSPKFEALPILGTSYDSIKFFTAPDKQGRFVNKMEVGPVSELRPLPMTDPSNPKLVPIINTFDQDIFNPQNPTKRKIKESEKPTTLSNLKLINNSLPDISINNGNITYNGNKLKTKITSDDISLKPSFSSSTDGSAEIKGLTGTDNNNYFFVPSRLMASLLKDPKMNTDIGNLIGFGITTTDASKPNINNIVPSIVSGEENFRTASASTGNMVISRGMKSYIPSNIRSNIKNVSSVVDSFQKDTQPTLQLINNLRQSVMSYLEKLGTEKFESETQASLQNKQNISDLVNLYNGNVASIKLDKPVIEPSAMGEQKFQYSDEETDELGIDKGGVLKHFRWTDANFSIDDYNTIFGEAALSPDMVQQPVITSTGDYDKNGIKFSYIKYDPKSRLYLETERRFGKSFEELGKNPYTIIPSQGNDETMKPFNPFLGIEKNILASPEHKLDDYINWILANNNGRSFSFPIPNLSSSNGIPYSPIYDENSDASGISVFHGSFDLKEFFKAREANMEKVKNEQALSYAKTDFMIGENAKINDAKRITLARAFYEAAKSSAPDAVKSGLGKNIESIADIGNTAIGISSKIPKNLLQMTGRTSTKFIQTEDDKIEGDTYSFGTKGGGKIENAEASIPDSWNKLREIALDPQRIFPNYTDRNELINKLIKFYTMGKNEYGGPLLPEDLALEKQTRLGMLTDYFISFDKLINTSMETGASDDPDAKFPWSFADLYDYSYFEDSLKAISSDDGKTNWNSFAKYYKEHLNLETGRDTLHVDQVEALIRASAQIKEEDQKKKDQNNQGAGNAFSGVKNFATGGRVPVYAKNGTLVNYQPRGTDTVPAMLTPGEFVINRKATQKHLPVLKAINDGYYTRGGIVNYLSNGGIIAPKYYETAGGVAGTITVTHTHNVIINGDAALNKLSPDLQDIAMGALREKFGELIQANQVPGAPLVNPFDGPIA